MTAFGRGGFSGPQQYRAGMAKSTPAAPASGGNYSAYAPGQAEPIPPKSTGTAYARPQGDGFQAYSDLSKTGWANLSPQAAQRQESQAREQWANWEPEKREAVVRESQAKLPQASAATERLKKFAGGSTPIADNPNDPYGVEWDRAQRYRGPYVSNDGFGDINQRAKATTREAWIAEREGLAAQSSQNIQRASDASARREQQLRSKPGVSKELADWAISGSTAVPSEQLWGEIANSSFGRMKGLNGMSYQSALDRQAAFTDQMRRDRREQNARQNKYNAPDPRTADFWQTFGGLRSGDALFGLLQ